ncbi:MAG: hypothetical protein WD274_06935 [Acidimicrobiia bacterium]
MTTETLADQIQKVRQRLSGIEDERANVAPDDFNQKADLIDEERTLEARLAELRDRAAQEMAGAPGSVAGPSSDIGVQREESGKASGYERVPGNEQELNDTDGDQR